MEEKAANYSMGEKGVKREKRGQGIKTFLVSDKLELVPNKQQTPKSFVSNVACDF